jgi:hypothetical protein
MSQEEKRKLAAAALGDGSAGVARQRLSLQVLHGAHACHPGSTSTVGILWLL